MMWESWVTNGLISHMLEKTNEDDRVIQGFFRTVLSRSKPLDVVRVAREWNTYSLKKKAFQAGDLAGKYHIVRFFIMMDYLSNRIEGNV